MISSPLLSLLPLKKGESDVDGAKLGGRAELGGKAGLGRAELGGRAGLGGRAELGGCCDASGASFEATVGGGGDKAAICCVKTCSAARRARWSMLASMK